MLSDILEDPILDIVSDLSGAPSYVWERNDRSFEQQKRQDQLHPCASDLELRAMMEKAMGDHQTPMILFENEFVFFGLMQYNHLIVCFGPVLRIPVAPGFSTNYFSQHGIESTAGLSICSTGTMTRFLALVYCHFTGESLSYDQILVRSGVTGIESWQQAGDWEHYQIEQSESDREHHIGIDFEEKMMEIVKRGDTVAAKELLTKVEPEMEQIGKVASSQIKQAEYLTVSLITLLTRAAIQGGMNREKAYELGDVFLMQTESASQRGIAYSLIGYRAIYDFTDQVRLAQEARRNRSYIVEACKGYIAKNLRKILNVGDIAPAIGVSRTHLAHRFKQEEGITVQQYIQRERCAHAANLLKYSDYPISLIAEYMMFSTQSYFGSCFKQWYNMTPKEYREQNQSL